MTEDLMESLQQIGLFLNTKKTKILRCNPSEEESTIHFTEIGGDFVKIVGDDDSHKNLGRLLSTSPSNRINMEFQNRQRAAWASFHKQKSILLDHNVSLHLRLKYFDACVGPAFLFGIAVLPLSRFQIQKMDILQRKMLRRIVGWRRSEGEYWNITMT